MHRDFVRLLFRSQPAARQATTRAAKITTIAPIVAVAIRRASSFLRPRVDPKALQKNTTYERARHPVRA
jgi:hypothetical protein